MTFKKSTKRVRALPTNPNPFRVEFDEHDGEKFPTLVIWVKPPSLIDWSRFDEAHPDLAKGGRPLDTSGCVFKVEKVEGLKRADGEPIDTTEALTMPRVKLTLTHEEQLKLISESKRVGLSPATLARMLVRKGLGMDVVH